MDGWEFIADDRWRIADCRLLLAMVSMRTVKDFLIVARARMIMAFTYRLAGRSNLRSTDQKVTAHPISCGKDHIQVVMLDLARYHPIALTANYSEFPDSCFLIDLTTLEDALQALVGTGNPDLVKARGEFRGYLIVDSGSICLTIWRLRGILLDKMSKTFPAMRDLNSGGNDWNFPF